VKNHHGRNLTNPADAFWYVVCTTPTGHFRARDELRAQSFHAHLPIEKTFVRRAGRRHKVERPLFGRYMFVGMVAGQVFEDITETDGVSDLLRNENGPARIPFDIISDLMMAEARGDFDKTRGRILNLRPGEAVNVIAGPFTGFPAQVLEARGDGKWQVLLKALGGGKWVVDEDAIEPSVKEKAA